MGGLMGVEWGWSEECCGWGLLPAGRDIRSSRGDDVQTAGPPRECRYRYRRDAFRSRQSRRRVAYDYAGEPGGLRAVREVTGAVASPSRQASVRPTGSRTGATRPARLFTATGAGRKEGTAMTPRCRDPRRLIQAQACWFVAREPSNHSRAPGIGE